MPLIEYVSEAVIWKMISDINIVQEIPNLDPNHAVPQNVDRHADAMTQLEFHDSQGRIDAERLAIIRRNHRILALLIKRCNFTYKHYKDAKNANYALGAIY